MRRIMVVALLGIWGCICSQAVAAPISYTISGTGSGTLGAASFTDKPFIITLTADTNNIVFENEVYTVPVDVGTFQVDLLGNNVFALATFTTPKFVFVNPDSGTFGLTDDALGLDIFNLLHPNFENYNLAGPLPPFGDASVFGVDAFQDIPSTGGNISLNAARLEDVTFQAQPQVSAVVPEPTTLALLCAAGVGCLMAAERWMGKRPR